jgi:hypothetical protein
LIRIFIEKIHSAVVLFYFRWKIFLFWQYEVVCRGGGGTPSGIIAMIEVAGRSLDRADVLVGSRKNLACRFRRPDLRQPCMYANP